MIPPLSGLQHALSEKLHQPERRPHVGIDLPQVFVERPLEKKTHSRKSRVVDQQPNFQAFRLSDDPAERLGTCQVERQAAYLDGVLPCQATGQRLQHGLPPCHQHQVQPAPGQFFGIGCTQALRCARNQCPGAVFLKELFGGGWLRYPGHA